MLLGPRIRISFYALLLSTMQPFWRISHLLFLEWFECLHHVSKSPTPFFTISTKNQNNSRMRLPVWRFGWGQNTAKERYGTSLHRASACGDDCWIEHGTQVCPTSYVQWIFSIAHIIRLNLFVFWNVKPGRITVIYGRKFCCQRNIKRQLRHNSPSFFRIMGQIQVLPKQTKLRRGKYIATVPIQPCVLPHHTHE